MRKRLFSLLLAAVMIFGLLPVGALAETSGKCGNDLTWTLNENVLTIGGTGAMNNYSGIFKAPWHSERMQIKSVVLESGVTSIGNNAFIDCSVLTDVAIPEGVTSIGNKAFENCVSLTSAVIPEGVTSIGDKAFENCVNMTSVSIPGSLVSIGAKLFGNCASLESITISEGITSIDGNAFNSCYGLKSVAIPKSVTSIGANAFSSCMKLENVYISDVAAWCAISFGSSSSNPLCYADKLYLNGEQVTELVIPEGVTSICDNAFNSCKTLTGVTIPKSVTSIGADAFSGCEKLENVYISDVAAWCAMSFGSLSSNPLHYADKLYLNGEQVTELVIPDGVTSICDNAFNSCETLTSVTIPQSITSIGVDAFSGCESLEKVYISDVAAWCAISLGSSSSNPLYYADKLYLNGEQVTKLVIPEGVTSICDNAFNSCETLTSVTIPKSVTSIGTDAFSGCENLENVYMSDIAAWCAISFGSSSSNPLCYAETMYLNNKKVTSLTIPDGVTEIADYAFYGGGFDSVTFPKEMARVGKDAFNACDELKHVFISDLTAWCSISFENGAANPLYYADDIYQGIRKLKNLTIPDSVTVVPSYVFYGGGFESVTIHENVTDIGANAFGACAGLKEINFNAKRAVCSPEAFSNAGNGDSGINVTFGANVESIPANMFNSLGRPNIKNVVFAGNAPTVGDNAFAWTIATAYYPYGNETWTDKVRQLNYGNGVFVWKAYSDAKVKSKECTIRKSVYVVGEELDTSGIVFRIERDDGCVEVYDYSSGYITLGKYSTTAEGWHAVTATCKDAKANLKYYVHGTKTVIPDSAEYPESSHDYENGLNKTYSYSIKNAISFKVSFSEATAVAENDSIHVNGTKYTGTELAGKTIELTGDTLKIKLDSDKSGTAYGFSIDKLEAVCINHSYTASVTAPTCTEKGYTTHTCACGDSYKDSVVPALGHNYVNGKCSRCGAVEALKIKTQPKSIKTGVGTVKFSVTASGYGLTYQWQYMKPDSKTWTNAGAASAKTADYSVNARESISGYKYRCQISDASGKSVTSSTATLTVVPVITKQPADLEAVSGTTGKFSVTVTGNELTYQWQYSTDGGKTWTNSGATNATSANFSVSAREAIDGYKYRCKITNSCGKSVTSDVATLTVVWGISKQPSDLKAASGTTGKFSITAGGDGLSYQWQYQNKGSSEWTNATAKSAKTATLSVSVREAINGHKYRCVVTNASGESKTSDVATLYVVAQITKQPTDLRAKSGTTGKISITAKGDGLSYQWQYQNKGSSTWTNATAKSAKTATFSVSVRSAINGNKYRCQVTNSLGNTVTSEVVTLTVTPAITKQPTNLKAASGTTCKFSITADGVGLSYQWQYQKTGSSTWTNSTASSSKTASLSVSVRSAINGYKYRCVVKDSAGNSITSSTATLTVE